MSRHDRFDGNAHHTGQRVAFTTLPDTAAADPLPDDLIVTLAAVDADLRVTFPEVFAAVDAIKATPGWRPTWASDVCGKCGSSDWHRFIWRGTKKRFCNECRRRYQQAHPPKRKAG